MRKVYRSDGNKTYWDKRWRSKNDSRFFEDLNIYPIKYARMILDNKEDKALEIGCGLGRVLKHYHYNGYNIFGIERSEVAVKKILVEDGKLNVSVGDVLNLPYPDSFFDVIMAFGLYHNLENELLDALKETVRCLKPGGRFCISMRPNNLEMWTNEIYWRMKNKQIFKKQTRFHKLLVSENEFKTILFSIGLKIRNVYRARNMSLLYRMPFLRCGDNKEDNEAALRSKGYKLNKLGIFIDNGLMKIFPYQFCNVLVFVGNKDSKRNNGNK